MFADLSQEGDRLTWEADVCIVGTGPAGIAAAIPLIEQGRHVCLLESGGLKADENAQDLADGTSIGRAIDLRAERRRQFGGTSTMWAGSCAPMSPSDFNPRPWVGLEGWPYTYNDLLPFYQRAQAMFDIGPFVYDPAYWSHSARAVEAFGPDDLETRIWQFSPRKDFGQAYHQRLKCSDKAFVLLNATATKILSDETARSIIGIEARALNERTATIRAKLYVLACGGIDNPRLLLLSRDRAANGLGNDNGVVGRYFMQHPHVGAASVHFSSPKGWLKAYKNHRIDGTWVRARLGLTPQAQERHGILNPVASFINRFVTHSLTHTQSIGYVTLKHVLLEAIRGQIHPHLPREILKIAGDVPGVVSGIWHHLRHQTGALYFMGEQSPNPASRITLGSRRDGLGIEEPVVDWRLSSEDKRAIRVMVMLIDSELQRLGLGRAEPDDWLVSDDTTWPDDIFGGFHHMGTTRMGNDPKNSVVDADARVHGINNLYIAGSSIFPTVGCANPTLTIVATALKLADHLSQRLARSSESSLAGGDSVRRGNPALQESKTEKACPA